MRLKSFLFFFLFITLSSFSQSKIFIKFKDKIDITYQTSLLQKSIDKKFLFKFSDTSNKTEISPFKNRFGQLNDDLDRIFSITVPNNIDQNQFISSLIDEFDIEYIHKSRIFTTDNVSTDSLINDQWGIFNVRAPEIWDLIPTDDILLAVIDTGIDYFHPDLKNKIYFNYGEIGLDNQGNDKSTNEIDDDNNGFIDDFQGWDFVNKLDLFYGDLKDDFTDWDNEPFDENGHGTNISGIIAAEHNSFGIAGVLPSAKIMNLRAFDKNGFGEEDDVASAILYAVKNGAKVINMSFGDSEFSELLKDVLDYASENGVILIASAGNNSSDLPHYPSGFSNVISVGAIQGDEILASYSNFGSSIDLVAPGSQILTTNIGNSYKKVSGTSASAPFVSAAAALLASIYNYSPEEIKQIIKTTSRDLGETGWDTKYGAGTLNIEKAFKLALPSEISINFPLQDYTTSLDSIDINISTISPYFLKFELFYGIGFNPINWEQIITGKENYQQFKEDIFSLNISNFVDTVYTLRLVMKSIDNRTFEERINFSIDRTPPKVLFSNVFPVTINLDGTFHAAIQTDDKTNAKLFYRLFNSNDDFKFIYLDGLNSDQKIIKNFHFGLIPINDLSGDEYEFYFEVENLSGLKTLTQTVNNFISETAFVKDFKNINKKQYVLPNGRIFQNKVKIGNIDEPFFFINEIENPSNLTFYKFNSTNFTKEIQLKNRIPISVGDFNNDGKTDILSLFVKNGFIDTQNELSNLEFINVIADSSGSFWPAHASDIDNDGKTEIVVISNDSTITVWEVGTDFSLTEEVILNNSIKTELTTKSIFISNKILVDDFDGDNKNEIIVTDNLGNLISFKILGANLYSDSENIEYFYPLASNTNIAKGDFNGDGILDIAILRDFEEDYFGAPLKYLAILTLIKDSEIIWQNMFLDPATQYVSAFQKKYNALNFNDINNNGSEELFLSIYPNAYIFSYDDKKTSLQYFTTNVNTQIIFIDDIDGNGLSDFAIPQNDQIEFYEFFDDNLLSPPFITDYFSIDSNKIFLSWEESPNPVYIFRGTDYNSLQLIDSSFTATFVDLVEKDTKYFYSLIFYDKNNKKYLSNFSNIIEVISHAPVSFKELIINNPKNIEIIFSGKLNNKAFYLQNILIDSLISPNSISSLNENSITVTLDQPLKNGFHLLSGKNFRDFFNSKISEFSQTFEVDFVFNVNDYLFIRKFEILSNNSLVIQFNFNLDSLIALDINNYSFIPNNLLRQLNFYNNNKNEIFIETLKPVASIGKEHILNIKNLISDKESGNLPLKENAGSSIILRSNAENLNNVFVYPNPANIKKATSLTFANLTSKAEIYIFDVNGAFIKKLKEFDGDGGAHWDFKDENHNTVNSGIYIFKVYSLDNSDNKLNEKIGKFVIIK